VSIERFLNSYHNASTPPGHSEHRSRSVDAGGLATPSISKLVMSI
jgi:hypothetical protein